MKKFLVVLLIIFSVLMISGCSHSDTDTEDENKNIEREVKQAFNQLPKEEQKEINFDNLLEDVYEIDSNGSILNAVYNEEDNKYYGDGYYIVESSGGEVRSYVFYVELSDDQFYIFEKYYPMSYQE